LKGFGGRQVWQRYCQTCRPHLQLHSNVLFEKSAILRYAENVGNKINYMPYIKKEVRQKLDPKIDELVNAIAEEAQKDDPKTTFIGILNYTFTTTALKTTKKLFGQLRYWIIASLTGLFHNLADEFYRRLAAPYEEEQIKKNGDLELYKKF